MFVHSTRWRSASTFHPAISRLPHPRRVVRLLKRIRTTGCANGNRKVTGRGSDLLFPCVLNPLGTASAPFQFLFLFRGDKPRWQPYSSPDHDGIREERYAWSADCRILHDTSS